MDGFLFVACVCVCDSFGHIYRFRQKKIIDKTTTKKNAFAKHSMRWVREIWRILSNVDNKQLLLVDVSESRILFICKHIISFWLEFRKKKARMIWQLNGAFRLTSLFVIHCFYLVLSDVIPKALHSQEERCYRVKNTFNRWKSRVMRNRWEVLK